MNIPFLDLHQQYTPIKSEIDKAIKRVIDSQYFILGKELSAFEEEFADYLGVKYVVGVGSGTDGLILALWALGIGKGDEVITPANSFIATTIAITQIGATPVFVDIDPLTYQIDIEQVKKKITKKTKAILPVHLYGAPCDIEQLVIIAKKHNIFLVEDVCQAHGALVNKKKVGAFGDVGVFSFYPGKNLGAYGDGGAISTNSKQLYERLLHLRNYGQTKKYHHDTLGVNSRLDELQAAVLRVKLRHLDQWNRKRNEIAKFYTGNLEGIKTQTIIKNSTSAYHLFVMETERRDELQDYLAKNDIHTLIHYPVPIHLQQCYRYLGYKAGDFPISETVSKRILSLPMYAEFTKEKVAYVTKHIAQFLKNE